MLESYPMAFHNPPKKKEKPKRRRMRIEPKYCEELSVLVSVKFNHFPVRKPKSRARCMHCWFVMQRRHETIWMCEECNTSVCMDCFKPWHEDFVKNMKGLYSLYF